MLIDIDYFRENTSDIEVGYFPILLAASSKNYTDLVLDGLQVSVENNVLESISSNARDRYLPGSESKMHAPLMDMDLNWHVDNPAHSNGIGLVMSVFDRGCYSHLSNSRLDQNISDRLQGIILTAFGDDGYFELNPNAKHRNKKTNRADSLLSGAAAHVHDEVFWRELLSKKPELLYTQARQYSVRSKEYTEKPLYELAGLMGNEALLRVLVDQPFIKSLKQSVLEPEEVSKKAFGSFVYNLDKKGGARILRKIMEDGYGNSPLYSIVENNENYAKNILSGLRKADIKKLNLHKADLFFQSLEPIFIKTIHSEVNQHHNKDVAISYMLKEFADAGMARAVIAAANARKDLGLKFMKNFDSIFEEKHLDIYKQQYKLLLKNLADYGYDFTQVKDEKGKSLAHLVAAEVKTSDYKIEMMNYAISVGMPMNNKDNRKWSPVTYLSEKEKTELGPMIKAMEARDAAANAAQSILKELRM